MTAANSTASMPFSNSVTAGEANSTESTLAFESSSVYDYEALFPDLANSWTARLLKYWNPLFWSSLGLVLSSLVIYLSLFNKKHINGNYKWFILNQALASFCFSLGYWLMIAVIYIGFGVWHFFDIYDSSSCPFWMNIFQETVYTMHNVGYYAQMTTLLLTVLNRFIAIAFPARYSNLMTPRLIFLYCILSYIVLIPREDHIYPIVAPAGTTLHYITYETYELVPWILSTVLSIVLYCILLKRQRNMINVVDERTLKDSQTVLRAVLIETVFIFFHKIFGNISDIVLYFGFSYFDEKENNWFVNILFQISHIAAPMTAAFPCLAILITMRPYREAVLSYFSPVKKCFKCLTNRVGSNNIRVQPVSTQRTPVISVRTVPSANNGGTIVQA